MEDALLVQVVGGLVIGAAFGAVVQRTNFCIMGAVADYALGGSLLRMRAWLLAMAVAVLGSQVLDRFSAVTLAETFYRAPELPLGGLVLGGLLFGFGMVIACGCTSRSLVNAAAGDLRALITVAVIGISAYMTVRGLFAYPRLWFTQWTSVDLGAFGVRDAGVGGLLAAGTGLSSGLAGLVASAVVVVALLAFTLGDRAFRGERRYLFAGVSLGLLVAAGWYLTGVLGNDEFDPRPAQSMRFVVPIGESLQYLMLFTGSQASFAIAIVAGVLLGGWVAALASGTFRLRAFEDQHDLLRYLTGGVAMGVGGVLALGCTVGQGLTGVSTLALGSFIATGAIVAGGIFGVRYLEQGTLVGAVQSLGNAVLRRA